MTPINTVFGSVIGCATYCQPCEEDFIFDRSGLTASANKIVTKYVTIFRDIPSVDQITANMVDFLGNGCQDKTWCRMYRRIAQTVLDGWTWREDCVCRSRLVPRQYTTSGLPLGCIGGGSGGLDSHMPCIRIKPANVNRHASKNCRNMFPIPKVCVA